MNNWNSKTNPEIIIPEFIINVCKTIQKKLGRKEFSILVKPELIREKTIILSTEYAIPKQEVTFSTVDLDPEDILKLTEEGYTIIIHSHHDMGTSFSSTDEHYLHSHTLFDASILYANNGIEGIIIGKDPLHGSFEIPATIVIESPEIEIDISNIKEKQVRHHTSSTYYTSKPKKDKYHDELTSLLDYRDYYVYP